MNSPLFLPPRGILVPTAIIFHEQLPASALLTWLKLRCLAWRGWQTPAFTLPELASLLGIHPGRLERHLSQLQEVGALSWRILNDGRLVITFPEEPYVVHARHMQAPAPLKTMHSLSDEHNPEELGHYFPEHILGYLSCPDDEPEPSYYFVSSFEQAFIKENGSS